MGSNNKQSILDEIGSAVKLVGNNVIWKIFLYKFENERYTENGTLHTKPRTYSSDGYPTTTLAANDTYLNITEFDAEVLMIEPRKQHKIFGVEAISGVTKRPILPFNQGVDYLWLEAQGGSYNIAANGVVKNRNNVIEVTLGSRP